MRVVCSINSAKTIELGAQNLFFELAAAIGIAHGNNFSILFASTSSYKDPGSILNFRVTSNFLSSGSGSRIFEFLNFQFFFRFYVFVPAIRAEVVFPGYAMLYQMTYLVLAIYIFILRGMFGIQSTVRTSQM
jgi:hypothetical protein